MLQDAEGNLAGRGGGGGEEQGSKNSHSPPSVVVAGLFQVYRTMEVT